MRKPIWFGLAGVALAAAVACSGDDFGSGGSAGSGAGGSGGTAGSGMGGTGGTAGSVSGACVGASDGKPCGTGQICIAEQCAVSVCGDGVVDPARGETCDDANGDDTDGCSNECERACTSDAACDDGDACNGVEICDVTASKCVAGTPKDCDDANDCTSDSCDSMTGDCVNDDVADGTACMDAGTGGFAGATAICISGSCQGSACKDGYVDTTAGEDCEDGNDVDGDGCDNDCTWSCTKDADCDDSDMCTEGDGCDLATHTCKVTTPLTCTPSSACVTAACEATSGCTETRIDGDSDGAFPDDISDGSGPCGMDCDDTDPDVKPGQTMWFAEAKSGIGFDYDCSGTEEKRWPTIASSTCPLSDCAAGHGWTDIVPDCGKPAFFSTCTYNVQSGICVGGSTAKIQECH